MIRPLPITHGEVCWLERRRAGQTAEWWAMKHGLSIDEVRLREQDERDLQLSPAQLVLTEHMVLRPGEFAALARRRHGATMSVLGRQYGVSRMTVWKMEHDITSTARQLAHWWARRLPMTKEGARVVTVGLIL